jgi:tetratricopeptide (TPR) repeat protein
MRVLSLAARSQKILWALAALSLSAIGFLPLFAGPTYEFGLAVGVLVPLLAAPFNAWTALERRSEPKAAFHQGQLSGFVLIAIAVLVAGLHLGRAGACDPLSEAGLFLAGPLPGVWLACVWGACAGAFVAPANTLDVGKGRRALAICLGLAGPLGGILVSLLRYYTSPIIFAFDHFFGYFSGTPYDTVLDGVGRLMSYRVGSFGWALVLYALAATCTRDERGRLTWYGRERARTWALGAFGLVLGVGITANGPKLGHYQTDRSVQEALGRSADSRRCRVVYASGIRPRDAHALARECDAYVEQHERFFDVKAPDRTLVYLFDSSEQKAWYMGARDVYIAKPWREEIYIQARGYPHPVIGHELAHVVAGRFGIGPFKIAGPLGGWIPDPGRIEGVAVAASPREDDDLTLAQWARAMRDADLLPALSSVFKLGFLAENSGKAYTVAGAFLSFLREVYGPAAVRGWYGGQTLLDATGKSLEELELEFRASLDQVTVSALAKDVAKARFDRPGVFARKCPHQVDETLDEANQSLRNFDPNRARQLFEKVQSMAPDEFWADAGLGTCELREKQLSEAQHRFEAMLAADPAPSSTERAWLEEQLGDLAWQQNDLSRALHLYATAASHVVDQDLLRTLTLKQAVLPNIENAELAREAVKALLLGEPETGTSFPVAAGDLGRWSQASTKDGLADYLLGKNLSTRGDWEAGAIELDRALSKGIGVPVFRAEALRTRVFMACALGQRSAAESALNDYLALADIPKARRDGVRRFAERCGLGSAVVPGAANQ